MSEIFPVEQREIDQRARDRQIDQLESDLAAERERSAAWEQTAQQESRNRDYYRGLLVAIGEKFGLDAKTQDDGGVVDDVLVAKVPELVDGIRERSAALAATLDHPRVWEYLNDCHGGKMAPAILAAHDAEVSRAAKIEALEEGIRWGPRYDDGVSAVTASYEWRGYIRDRIAALQAEGGKG